MDRASSWRIEGGAALRDGAWGERSVFLTGDRIVGDAQEGAAPFDASGCLVVPGFIDSHTYGAGGFSTESAELEDLVQLAAFLPRFGVTAFVASTPATSCEHLRRVALACREQMRSDEGSALLGLYSEGMCANPIKAGAQRVDLVPSDPREFGALLDEFADVFRLVTLAPELPESEVLLERCLANGIGASFGHSAATGAQVAAAFAAGYRHVTHLFNAMGPLEDEREDGTTAPGAPRVSIEAPGVYVEMIADGHHVDRERMKLAFDTKERGRMILVTDSMPAAGTGFVGEIEFAGQRVQVTEEAARLPNGRPAASILTLDRAVANIARWECASREVAIEAATANPAAMLGCEDRGSLAPGSRGDVVVLDAADLSVVATWCRGRLAYRRG